MESVITMLSELASEIEEREPSLDIYDKLVASEVVLLNDYYNSIGHPLSPGDPTGGILELSPILYFLNNPPEGFEVEVKLLVGVLDIVDHRSLPESSISTKLWPKIIERTVSPGLIASDGTVYGMNKYDQLDPGWLISVAGWIYHWAQPGKIHPFATGAKTIPLAGSGSIKIGIVGDWGTGKYGANGGPAPAVMQSLQASHVKPDYLMHLGDVYYAGDETEEQENLLDLWPAQWGPGKKQAFTLNSNHEMYDGANGYFKTALATGGPFTAQAGVSYYAATFGNWLILGLDSAWHSDPAKMYMYGSIGGAQGKQGQWITELVTDPNQTFTKVMVLTHHNPMTTAGDAAEEFTPLYTEVLDALQGKAPDYWYFGHTHNGVAYKHTSFMGAQGTKARLCGHGAMPFGNAWIFASGDGKDYIDYYAHTPVPGSQVLMRNGFATVELHADGGITETMYELTDDLSDPFAAWSATADN